MQYGLYRIEDDATTTLVSEHPDVLTSIAAGGYAVEVEDFDYAYCLQGTDGVRSRCLMRYRTTPKKQDRG